MKINNLVQAKAPSINRTEASLTKIRRCTLFQLTTIKSPFLLAYTKLMLHTIPHRVVPFVIPLHFHICGHTVNSSGFVDEPCADDLIVRLPDTLASEHLRSHLHLTVE